MTSFSPHGLGIIFAVLAAIGFSAKAILIKLAYAQHVDALTMLALRMDLAAPLFVLILLWVQRDKPEPLSRHDWGMIVGLGLLGYYLSSLLDFLGLQYISAGLERMILFLYPTMTVLLLALFQRRGITKNTTLALLLSYAGIALAFWHDVRVGNDAVILGAALVLASTLSYSLYLVGAGHAIRRIGATRFTACASLVSCSACLLHFAVTHPLHTLRLPYSVYELALYMAIFSTVLPVLLLSYAIQRIGAGKTSLLGNIGPISTLYMAYVFLGEAISLLQLLGMALVMAGVLMISRKN